MSAFGSSPLTSSLTGSDGEDEIGLSPPVPTSSILSSTPTRVVAGVTSTRKRKRVIDSDGSFNESTRTLQNAILHSKHDRSTKLKDLEDRSDKLIDDEDSIDELALTDNQFAGSPRVRRRGYPSSVSNSSRSTDRQETAFSRREKEKTNHPETPTRRLYKYRERLPSIPSPESEEMTLDTSRIQIPHISHDYHGLAGLLPIRRREHSIIDLTTPSPPNSNTDLIDEPPASQGESIFSDAPLYDDLNSREAPQHEDIDSTLEARGPPSTIQEDVSPSASKVVDLIEFESFFTNPKPELKESVEEIAHPSTDKRAHSAEKSPEMLLSSKEAVTYDNSSIALRMRKFVDGVRATQQGLVKWWLGGPNQSSGSPEEISRPRSPSAGAAFADDNLFLDTPSRAGSELSTTLVHGEVGAPRVNLIAWSSVMNESPTSSASVGIHLQQRSVPSPFSLENVHFSTPPNAVGKSGSVKLIRRRSGVVVPPLGQLSTADNDSTFFAQLKSSKESVEQEVYPSQDLDSQLSTQIVTSRLPPVEFSQKFLSEKLTRSPSPKKKGIYYTPTRHFSHVEVTGMPHYRITTKGGLKITPLPGFVPKKNGVRKDDSDDDLYFKSPTPKSHFNIHRTLQTNSRKKSSSGPGLYQAYDESISGWQSGSASEDNENYDDDSGDSDEYLYEDAVPRSQIQGHKRRRLNSPLPGFFNPFSVRVSDNSTGLTPSLARTSLKVRDQYPFGQCVDEINITNVVIQPVKHGSSGTLCHNCRSGNGNRSLRARCQHRVSAATVSDPDAFVRCNKSYCERCLRFWYGMDDDAMNFILYGNRNSEGRIGTGLGMGIIEGTWLCPWCINLCMCTFCQRKRGESRTRFRPSLRAKIAQPPPSPRRKLPKLRLNICIFSTPICSYTRRNHGTPLR
ncbi:hypothetical protein CPB86DRAFT_477591 [Serendipita vermifera]|nr:hypothetical protein CPB86DRAFT_477591 [Serendipita vermifera]